MRISAGHYYSRFLSLSVSLCLSSSPCRQRRLSVPAPRSVAILAQSATFPESPSYLKWPAKPVSFGCAPEGAKPVPRVARLPVHAPRLADGRMKDSVCRRATCSQRSFLAACRGRRLASTDFSPSLVVCHGRALRRPLSFFGVSGSLVAFRSGSGLVAKDAQPTLRADWRDKPAPAPQAKR